MGGIAIIAIEYQFSFLPFYFRVCAFSIQRTRLFQNLEQAMSHKAVAPIFMLGMKNWV